MRNALPRRVFPFLFGALLTGLFPLLSGSLLVAQEPPELVDRVVAVVSDEPILISEIEELISLGLAERQPGESEDSFRRRVLENLIDQRVRLQAVERFGFEQAPVSLIEDRVQEIQNRFGNEEEFLQRMRRVNFTEAELRQLVARQLSVLTYVEERLGARVFVDLDEIRAYYDNEFAPALAAQGEEVPPLDEVRERLRALIREIRLNEEIERWTSDLRNEADISVFFDEPRVLPRVVGRVEEAAEP
ncbi:MAG: hypothetical protein AAF481_10490 [Acidobacteriota bacterium]